jgi:general secretion pathway protein G
MARIRTAFTLVEILIVVVILGILAAIVIPQFTSATQDAQAGNLKAQIASLQRQVELYRAKNNNTHPFATADWTTLISGNYIKAAPSNPASTYTDKTSLSTGASGTGSATTSWFYQTTNKTVYASFFNESTGAVSTTGTD